ncbi:MAG: glutathione S-transferase family protein [Pseudomonadota bacterium]
MSLTLFGFRWSVYTWIARWALFEANADYQLVERDPFSPGGCPEHPFNRVPVLDRDGRRIFETRAITAFVEDRCGALGPSNDDDRALIEQTISIADNYVYPNLVRKVFENEVFLPALGQAVDPMALEEGIDAIDRVLSALDGLVVVSAEPTQPTRADIHLAPMIDYFVRSQTGTQAIQEYEALNQWFDEISKFQGFISTRPGLPKGI